MRLTRWSVIFILIFFLANVWLSLHFEAYNFTFIRSFLYTLLAIATAILFASALFCFKKSRSSPDLLDFLIISFLFWQPVSAFFSSQNFSILPKAMLFNTGFALGIFLLIRHCYLGDFKSDKFAKLILWFVVILAILEGTILPTEYWTKFGIIKESGFGYGALQHVGPIPQVMSLFISPNYLAAFLILVISLSLWQLAISNWRFKKAVMILLCLSVVALSWTYTRSAWIAFIIILFIWTTSSFFFDKGKSSLITKIKLSFFLGALLFAGLTIRAVAFNATSKDILFHGTSTQLHQQSAVNYVSSIVKINPVWGLGPGYSGFVSFDLGENRLPESSYFQMWQEVGLVGLFLWLLINGIIGYKLFKHKKIGLLLGQIGLFIMALFLPIWSVPAISIWFFVLAGLSLPAIQAVSFAKNALPE